MPLAVQLSTFLGAGVLFWSVWCLAVPRRRATGIVVGCVGLLAGTAAALAYTLHHFFRGVDLDYIPHEPAAQWFVAAFGWAGLLAAMATAFVPSVRRRVGAAPC
jgi:hypothetical protein